MGEELLVSEVITTGGWYPPVVIARWISIGRK